MGQYGADLTFLRPFFTFRLTNCEDAVATRPGLFRDFIGVLHYQLLEAPSDFFVDVISTNNFLAALLQTFFSVVRECNSPFSSLLPLLLFYSSAPFFCFFFFFFFFFSLLLLTRLCIMRGHIMYGGRWGSLLFFPSGFQACFLFLLLGWGGRGGAATLIRHF